MFELWDALGNCKIAESEDHDAMLAEQEKLGGIEKCYVVFEVKKPLMQNGELF
jgi:hypothetical protein